MPRYFREIEVPAGTTQSQAVEVEIEVDERFIQDAMAYIDPGAKNQVSVERAFAPDTNNDHIVLVFFDTEDRDTRVQQVDIREADIFPETDVSDSFEDVDTVNSE